MSADDNTGSAWDGCVRRCGRCLRSEFTAGLTRACIIERSTTNQFLTIFHTEARTSNQSSCEPARKQLSTNKVFRH